MVTFKGFTQICIGLKFEAAYHDDNIHVLANCEKLYAGIVFTKINKNMFGKLHESAVFIQ